MKLSERHSRPNASAPSARRSLAPWRYWTILLTIVAFVGLLTTASTHNHASVADDQDCAVCSIVTHNTSDLPTVDLPKQVLVLISYAPFLAPSNCHNYVSPALLPPSCGPPELA